MHEEKNTCPVCGTTRFADHTPRDCRARRRARYLRALGWETAPFEVMTQLARELDLPAIIMRPTSDPAACCFIPAWVAAVYAARDQLGMSLVRFAWREGLRRREVAEAYAMIWRTAGRVEFKPPAPGETMKVWIKSEEEAAADRAVAAARPPSGDRRRFALADYVMTLTSARGAEEVPRVHQP